MDGLLAEINAKRKQLDTAPGPSSSSSAEPPRKYMRRGELEALQEEEERRKKAEAEEKREKLKAESRAIKMRKEVCRHAITSRSLEMEQPFADKQAEQARKDSASRMAASGSNTPEPSGSGAGEKAFNISPEECVRRLRLKGQPIRLFGETDRDRKLRLRALELLEARGEGGQNDFKRTLEGMETSMEEKSLKEMAKLLHAKAVQDKPIEEAVKEKEKKYVETGVIDLSLVKEDPNKLYPLIYYALKVGWHCSLPGVFGSRDRTS